MQDDATNLRNLRNRVQYDDYKNSIIEWTLSDRWFKVPGFMHIRGECVTRYISTKTGAKLTKIVANGSVSGEFETCDPKVLENPKWWLL